MSDYGKLGAEIGALVAQKQAAYGDSFGKSGAVMRLLYPDGIPPEKLDDALTVVRVVDKLFRIATDRDALGESPWRDIGGYALLAVERQERCKDVEALQEICSRPMEVTPPTPDALLPRRVCVDPEKMHGACDGFGGSDYP